MTKSRRTIRNYTVLFTLVGILGLSIYGQKVKEIRKDVEEQIVQEQMKIDDKHVELQELQAEIEKMDSDEYIKQVAREQLGMVDKDTIVFKIKD